VKTRYRFRFYPTEIQKKELSNVFGACRYVYNWALNIRNQAWKKDKINIGYSKTSLMLTNLKREENTKWLSEISCVPTQQSLRHLQKAFLNFWSNSGKYPSFKKKKNKQSAEYTYNAFKLNKLNNELVVSGLGKLNIVWSREFKSYPKTITITKEPSEKYYVTLCLDEDFKKLPKTKKNIGIDFGVSRLATLSDGTRISNPKYFKNNLKKLSIIQRGLSRKKIGSERWSKSRIRVARLHEHIKNCRLDTLHKFTTNLVKKFDTISVEDLSLNSMLKNRNLSMAISDVGIGVAIQMLNYKCNWYGKKLKKINRYFPSSKMCSVCGYVIDSLPLTIREWDCPKCKSHHDRDENAAKNINVAEGCSVKARGDNINRLRASAPRRNIYEA